MQDETAILTRQETQIEEHETKFGFIDVAWDRRQQRFVAYQEGARYIGLGVTVNDAKCSFIGGYWESLNEIS